MSVLGGWGVSGPRFDTIQDWASLANVKPSPSRRSMRRSVSSGFLPSTPSSLMGSPSMPALHEQTNSGGGTSTSGAGMRSPLQGASLAGSSPPPLGLGMTSLQRGTSRTPSSAFSNNPYQTRGVGSAVAASLVGGGAAGAMALAAAGGVSPAASPTHNFAIHQLPRAVGSPVARASSANARRSATSPITIPAGAPLPLSPTMSGMSGSSGVGSSSSSGHGATNPRRLTLVQQQALASRTHSTGAHGSVEAQMSPSYNPYLLSDSALPAAPGASGGGAAQQVYRKTKNLEQRLADYLKPARIERGSSNGAPASPTLGPRGSGNISVNVLLHPKTPLGSLSSPAAPAFNTSGGGGDSGGNRDDASLVNLSPKSRRAAVLASAQAEEDTLAATQAAQLLHSVKKGKKARNGGADDASPSDASNGGGASNPGGTRSSSSSVTSPSDEDKDKDGAHMHSQAPASMNLRAVLKEKKLQEKAQEEAAQRDQESKKPWTGVSWHEIVQAKLLLQQQAKARAAAAASGLAPPPSLTDKDERRSASQSFALQVAAQLLASSSAKASSSKKAFNVYSLSESQRTEYKYSVEQGKWLSMLPKEDSGRKELHASMYVPNDQKRISSKTRMMNMCKGDVTQQQAGSGGGGGGGGGGGSSAPPTQLLYNTYVSCNGQYGYVRYVGRVAWGNGVWVGMELVEPHPYAAARAPWVDFHSEQGAITQQLVEESPEQKAEQRKKMRASHNGTVADQMAAAASAGPRVEMMLNTAIPRPLVLAAMMPPTKPSPSGGKDAGATGGKGDAGGKNASSGGGSSGSGGVGSSSDSQFQPLSATIFPFIDVVCLLREGLASCFEMGELDPALSYFAPLDSVKRVAQKAKIDSRTLLAHKEQQTNPFADVDELACNTPKKHEGNIEMLARYLTVSDREVLDGDRNKARSIFRWICHNIRFDPTGAGGGHTAAPGATAAAAAAKSSTDVISIIRHRRATSEGFAQLFHALATAGGLQCLRIRGVEKQLNHRTDQVLRNKHAWNAIKIDGEWSFVDCVFSCGQYVDKGGAGGGGGADSAGSGVHGGVFQQMFSDAYFCTPPSLFILEHFPTDAFGDTYSKMLPHEYNNLQLLRSVVSAAEFERGLIPGRAFVEYHMRAAPFTYQVECKQPSYQIEITAPAFILFDVELRLKSHVVDLSSAAHIQYDGEQVTIFLIFPVPGEYVCRVKCKPSWREIDVYDNCLTYKLTSHTGLVPLSSNKDVIIGHLQHRKVNARDSRSLFNRHFTLLHPLSGHLIPKAPFIVQIKGPDIAESVIVACNGDWQRLSSSSLSKGGLKMFEGTCVIQPRYELQIFYEMDKKFHLLYYYKANLTSFSNVYLEKDKAKLSQANMLPAASAAPELWHGKCALGIEGRVFDANLSLDVPNCKFGKQVCIFVIHVSVAWDVALQVQEGWKNGTPLQDNQVVVEEMKNFRNGHMTQYKITTTLPATAMLEARAPAPSADEARSPQSRLRSAVTGVVRSMGSPPAGVMAAAEFANALADGADKRRSQDAASIAAAAHRRQASNLLPTHVSPDPDDAPKASTQFVLVINARHIKTGGPMRYCLSYYFDVAKVGVREAQSINYNQQRLTIDTD